MFAGQPCSRHEDQRLALVVRHGGHGSGNSHGDRAIRIVRIFGRCCVEIQSELRRARFAVRMEFLVKNAEEPSRQIRPVINAALPVPSPLKRLARQRFRKLPFEAQHVRECAQFRNETDKFFAAWADFILRVRCTRPHEGDGIHFASLRPENPDPIGGCLKSRIVRRPAEEMLLPEKFHR
jgi:hypothetical protein